MRRSLLSSRQQALKFTNVAFSSSKTATTPTTAKGPTPVVASSGGNTRNSGASTTVAFFSSSSSSSSVDMASSKRPLICETLSVVVDDVNTKIIMPTATTAKMNGSTETPNPLIDDHISLGNIISPSAKESLDRLIQYHKRQRILMAASNAEEVGQEEFKEQQRRKRSQMEYEVLRQMMMDVRKNRNNAADAEKFIEYAMVTYPWMYEDMWNVLLSYQHPSCPVVSWKVCQKWNTENPSEASLGMYRWCLSSLANQGLYHRATQILQHLRNQNETNSASTLSLGVCLDIDCYHYGLMACQYHFDFSNPSQKRRQKKNKKNKQVNGGSQAIPNCAEIQNIAHEIYQEAPYPRPVDFYRSYLSILAKDENSGKKEGAAAGQRALQVLKDMESSKSTPPDLMCYNIILNTLAKEGHYKEATRILGSMIKLGNELKDDSNTIIDDETSSTTNANIPNLVISFHTVLKALLEANTEDAAKQAENVIEIMWKVANLQKRPDYEPTAVTYQQVIAIWTKLGQPQRALTLLEELQNLYKSNKNQNSKFLPDAVCYRTVIGGLSKVKGVNSEIAEQATFVLRNMYDIGHDINAITINTCLKCWANAGQPEEAEWLLDEISQSWKDIPLDVVSYNTIISAYARQGNVDRAQQLLDKLLTVEHHHNQGEGESSPRKKTTNQKQQPQVLRPNTLTFTSVISALAKQRTIQSAELAEKILLQMQELYEEHDYDTRPNIYTYNALLSCWSNIDDPKIKQEFGAPRAELILRNMQDHLPEEEQPNVITYNTILQAHSNSPFGKVEDLLDEMIFQRQLEPNASTRNTVMTILYRSAGGEKDNNLCNIPNYHKNHNKAHEVAKKYFPNVKAQHRNSRKKEERRRRQNR